MSGDIERIEALFNRAIEFRPEERVAFLVGACGKDSALLARLTALLQAHEADEAILPEQPRAGMASQSAEKPGDRIGHYKLLEQIGEGGCGVVYMAEQEAPVRRRVALKIIKLGMDTKNVVARFEAERHALALMDHPNIARVFDAGTTQAGRPFFVMELVRGTRITDFCNQNDLSTGQRLDLFLQVCRAIQHAHQKGIIHRDIKPSNVLVSVHDGVPMPKVIDFGIAKAIEGRLTDQTLFTSFEQFIGTPAYMSPEQAELKGLDVDTRTDIYSLGVLLYELLTGKTPFDARELLSVGLDEMRRTIREKEPVRPSTRLTQELAQAGMRKGVLDSARELPEQAPSLDTPSKKLEIPCERRSPHDTKDLIQQLRGDLDWIVMKCLEKDRKRRYETANGLAMDLQRHLKSEPVEARPPSNLYRFQKLIQRNKVVFAATAAVAAALVFGIIGSTLEAIRARHAERVQALLREEADAARSGEAKQRAVAEQHLYEALLGEARAKQLSGRAGQRFESLDAISKAATIKRSTELSDAAIAALALPDLREQKHWVFPSGWAANSLCFDDQFELYAYLTSSGISVRRVRGDEVIANLPLNDVSNAAEDILLRRFDPRGRYLAASCATTNGVVHCRVWDLTRDGDLVLDMSSASSPDFSPDGQTIALLNPDSTVSIQKIESRKDLKRLTLGGKIDGIRLSPDGTKLAGLALGSSIVRICDVASGQAITTLQSAVSLSFLAWSQDGMLLATGSEDGEIDIWDTRFGKLKARLEGHESRVTTLAFSHHGDLLASGGWDSTLRLWDVARGCQLVLYRTQDAHLHFSPDDRLLAYAVEGENTRLLEVAHSTGYHRLVGASDLAKSWGLDYSPDGRFVAASTISGIGFWDLSAGREIGFLRTPGCRSAHFQTNGGSLRLIATTDAGIYLWPLSTDSVGGSSFLRVGPPKILMAQDAFRYHALAPNGDKILVSFPDGSDPLVVDLANPTSQTKLKGQPGAEFVAWDSSGRWVATGTWKGHEVNVYEASSGQILGELPVNGTSVVAFSPDGNWLATSTMKEFRFWKTGSWEAGPHSLPGNQVSEINPVAFSPDGHLLARIHAPNEIQIVKVPSCEVIATLRAAEVANVSAMQFSPDGGKLAVLEWSGQMDLWDLRIIRDELKKLNLDWKLPPFPLGTEIAPTGATIIQLDAGPFSKAELAQTIPPRDANASANLIDLTDYYNAPLTQSWHSPKKSQNDLSELRPGRQNLGGIEFDVRGLIQIGATAANGLAYPRDVQDISIRRQCRRLHFLHAAIFAAGADPGNELGRYIIHYADGRQIELPIVAGTDMADWWSQPEEGNMSFVVAWTGSNRAARAAGHNVRLFHTTWENPFPDVLIKQLDFVSGKAAPGQPFLAGITAEP